MRSIREDIDDVLGRRTEFYKKKKPGSALVQVYYPSCPGYKNKGKALGCYQLPDGARRMADDVIFDTTVDWHYRQGFNDDRVPAVGCGFGITDLSGFIGGNVRYGETTSWHEPFMDSVRDIDKLKLDENNFSYRLNIDTIRYIAERCDGWFFPRVRGSISTMEIANLVRGTDYFYDLYDDPEGVKILHDYIADCIVWYYNKQVEATGMGEYGCISGFDVWLPKGGYGHFSEDDISMISSDMFKEFCLPYTERVLSNYSTGFIHVHSCAERSFGQLADLKNVDIMQISIDPGDDGHFKILRRNMDTFRKVIPQIGASREDIIANMDVLKDIPCIIFAYASSREEADSILKLVREELPLP